MKLILRFSRIPPSFVVLLLMVTDAVIAQTPAPHQRLYEVVPDAEAGKLLKGILQTTDIIGDTSFAWYAPNAQYFRPKPAVVEVLKAKAGKYQLVLFAGTWCEDSHQLLPVYFKTFQAAGVPDSALTVIGVDRQKTTIANLHKVFNVPKTPTLIVLKEGRELGRIEEFGKTSLVDNELAEILKQL
jgi:hypothetical protein